MVESRRSYRKVLQVAVLILLVILASFVLVPGVQASNAGHPLAQTPEPPPDLVNQAPGYGVGWLSLAFINAGLAQGKNRRGLVWFLVSLLLGPIATFLLVTFFPKKVVTAVTTTLPQV